MPMKSLSFLFLGAVAAATAGCSTQFMGTAPATAPGKTYVVGARQNRAAIWLCQKNGSECQWVDVDDDE